MADVPSVPMVIPTGSGDLFGNNGMLSGLILGTLLRNGGLFGAGVGPDAVVAGGGQANANMSIMQNLGDIKQAVALSTATMETSNAVQTGQIASDVQASTSASQIAISGLKDVVNANTVAVMNQLTGVDKTIGASTTALMSQINGVEKSNTANAVALMSQLNGLDKSVMGSTNTITQAISNDGEKTRALIVSQYEATLNRQLSEANNALAELRGQQNLATATRSIEVNTTNNINQMQQQTQQQQQMQMLTGIMANLANDLQYIRATNQAINIGSGTQTANPINNNTNVRA